LNKWGISHINDNVSEWVISPDDTLAISRGGSWKTKNDISERQIIDPDSSNGYTGFRIARTYTPININKKPIK
jgi:formylglycine-generating enzyme required for sulfatase activity